MKNTTIPKWKGLAMGNILLATDLSPRDDKLITSALKIASTTGATLHILHVANVVKVTKFDDAFEEEAIRCQKYLETYIEQSPFNARLKYKVHIVDGGRVHDQISKYAFLHTALCIIVGTPQPDENAPRTGPTTLDKLVERDSYSILAITRGSNGQYRNIAFRRPPSIASIRSLNIIAPLTQSHELNIYGAVKHSSSPAAGYWTKLSARYKGMRDRKRRGKIRNAFKAAHALNRDINYIEDIPWKAQRLQDNILSYHIDLLVLNPKYSDRTSEIKSKNLKNILRHSPCDFLIIRGIK